MKEYTLIFNNPIKDGLKLTKCEFLVFDYILDNTSAADSIAQEGGQIFIISKDFLDNLKVERNVTENVVRSCITKLRKNNIIRKINGVSHVYQLSPFYYGKVYDENNLEEVYKLRENWNDKKIKDGD